MRYRKTFLILLAGSMLVMDGLWWYSLKNHTSVIWMPRPGHDGLFVGTFASASVTLAYASNMFGSPNGIITHPLDRIPYENGEAPGRLGKFRIGKGSPYGYPAGAKTWLVEFPIWFPWLLLAGGGYALLSHAGRHSSRLREMELALETSSGREAASHPTASPE